MMDSIRSETATVVESGQSATSWAAIIAGGVATAALTLVLLAFGSGMGFSAVSPWSNAGVSAGTFKLATGVYLIIVSMLSSTIGGYLAGRLRTKWIGLHSEEVLFRDTAHGFLAWAFAAVLGAAALVKIFGCRQAYENRPSTNPRACGDGLWGFRFVAERDDGRSWAAMLAAGTS